MLRPKYEIGQTVYIVTPIMDTIQTLINCDLCKSKGKVRIKHKLYKCPKCHGNLVRSDFNYKYTIQCKAKIIGINTEEFDKQAVLENSIRYIFSNKENTEYYSKCEEDCFITKQEAKDYCNKQNSSQSK